MSNLTRRLAQLEDIPAIEQLIERSVFGLSNEDYSEAQIRAALKGAWGVDTQLIKDQTYFVYQDGQHLVACGGWSFRKTLFGNDQEGGRDPEPLVPGKDAAKIRAFFVDPDYARQGLGSSLMLACESEARARGFNKLELMATLPGVRLYERHGFTAGTPLDYPMEDGLSIDLVPMSRAL